MSCYNCTKEFSFFHREVACPNCGFGFCSSCLKYKVVLPGKGAKEQKVCQSCYQMVSQPGKFQKMYAPPETLQKRLDSLQTPGGKPAVTVYRDRDKMVSLKRGMSHDDQKIVERLEQLHRERKELKPIPSDQEVRDRLQRLKGTVSTPATRGTYQAPDKRSNLEKSHDLLAAVSAEVELDSRQQPVLSPEADIAARLARLKGENVLSDHGRQGSQPLQAQHKAELPDPVAYLGGAKGAEEEEDIDEVAKLIQSMDKDVQKEAEHAMKEYEKDKAIQEQLKRLRVKKTENTEDKQDSEDEDDDESSAALLKQILAEQELEEKLGVLEVAEGDVGDEPGELPWCVMCNADAVLRCSGCGQDLYCGSCFKECHKGEDMEEHSTQKFCTK